MIQVQRMVMVAVVAVASVSFACSPLETLPGEQHISSESPVGARDANSTDKTAPAQVVISEVEVKKNAGPCPNIDVMVIHVTSSDDVTAAASLRYVAYFGNSAETAATAEPRIVFDATSATELELNLIGNGGTLFIGTPKCFALSAVDDAGNIGERSEARCVDTSKPTSGCSTAPFALLPLGLLLLRRRFSIARR